MVDIMKNLKLVQLLIIAILGVAVSSTLVSCYESNAETSAPAPIDPDPGPGPGPGLSFNGKVYYDQNCSSCHAAGADDTSKAFGAIDLANQESKIANNMSAFDQTYNTMGRFDNVDQERVDDLKKYLSGL
jgi:cytochrome c5